MTNAKKQWLIRGGVGAMLTGTGLCGAIESGVRKRTLSTGSFWVVTGTVSLIVFMAGINLITDSLHYKQLMNKDVRKGN